MERDWAVSTWWSENRTHSLENVWVHDDLLYLKVKGGTSRGKTSVGAEISTGQRLFRFGSFRATAKTSSEPGTVFGWFYYLNDETEIDIEILSSLDEQRLIHFTVHENIGPETQQVVQLPFRPSRGFHEYRFDWFPDRVEFIVDGRALATVVVNVPQEPGRIIMNHWTSSSDGWGEDLPSQTR